MRRILTTYSLILAWIVLFLGSPSNAQVPPPLPAAIPFATSSLTLSQSVTVHVQEINELRIVGDVHLTISTATAGTGPDPVSDASSATFNLTTNAAGKKITGAIDSPYSPGLTLSLLLGAPSGASTSAQTLGTTAKDLVNGINYAAETGLSISYTATAAINAAPNGSGETRTVTFTLVDN